jgi:hypothetical protein
MSIDPDESLRDHARLIRESYDVQAESIKAVSAEKAPTRTLPRGGPWGLLPKEVADAKEDYEKAMKVRLKFLKYVRSRDGELRDAIDDGQPLPQDPVQLTRSITVSSTQGAVVLIEQWLAEAEATGDNEGEGGSEP